MPLRIETGGELGNSRLTSLAGLLLLLLLFLEGLTIPLVHRLLVVHIFIGFILIPPILLKLASTGYRFVMYYAGNRRYRAIGPPFLLLRLAAPFLILTTVVLFWSGIELLVLGPQHSGIWKPLHVGSFLVWFCFMTVHVLAHTWKAARLGLSDLLSNPGAVESWRESAVAGVLTRRSLIAGSLVLGIVLAVSFLPMDHSWASWSSAVGR